MYVLIIVCVVKNDKNNVIKTASDHIIFEWDNFIVIEDKAKLDVFLSKQIVYWRIIYIMYNRIWDI